MIKNFIFLAIVMCNIYISKGQQTADILQKLFNVVKSTQTLQFTFDAKERVGKQTVNEIGSFKIQNSPFKLYMYQQKPVNGLEVLFVTNVNDNNAKVNPNAFPWVTLNLDPEGSLMLDKHHHSIFDAGFAYTSSIIEYLCQKYKSQLDNIITYKGIVTISGADCYQLTLINPNYKLVNYTVGENETPLIISKKLKINYYAILENNTNISGNAIIKAGTRLILPNDYASKMELYIQKDKYYPVKISIYDVKGMYEEYLFTNVMLNPVFKSDVFSASNKNYNF